MNTEIITPNEVAALNEARTVLERLARRHRGTIVEGAATIVAGDVFSVLNYTNAYLHAELTEQELHNAVGV